MNAEDLWDKYSQHVDDTLDSFQAVAGQSLITRADFMKAVSELDTKYFEKWLPVRGDTAIRNGDFVIDYKVDHLHILKYISGDSFISQKNEDVLLPNWKERFNFVRVRLFLCCRGDFQFGDKITLDGIEFVTSEGPDYDSSWEEIVTKGFKIIKLIS